MKHNGFKFRTFSKKQRQVLNFWTEDSPVKDKAGIIADGAIRSGKTTAMSLSYVAWAMANFSGENFAICGKTIKSCKRNVLTPLYKMLYSRGFAFDIHRADSMIEISYGGHTNFFYVFGGKDEASQDLIQGITLAGCFFDEVALMPESFVNQAAARCSIEGSKLWFNCNPSSPYHYFKKEWIDKAKLKKLLYLHFTMDDNLTLSEAKKQEYINLYTGVFFKRYIEGLWVSAEGLIYDMFNEDIHVIDVSKSTMKYVGIPFVSCDYGTQNATVFLLWQRGLDNKWYITREYYYSGRDVSEAGVPNRQKTDSEYADDLIKWLDGTKISGIVVDPAAASFKIELQKRGFRVVNAKNQVIDGIRAVSTALQEEKLFIDKSCKETIKEFAGYVWDEKAAERGEDKPVKVADHCMDALRYGYMQTLQNITKIRRKPRSF